MGGWARQGGGISTVRTLPGMSQDTPTEEVTKRHLVLHVRRPVQDNSEAKMSSPRPRAVIFSAQ